MVDMRRVILSIMLVLATLTVQSQTFYELTFTLPNSNSKFVGLLIYTDDEHCKMRLVDDEALAENSCYMANYTCGIKEKDVLDADLFLYNRQAPVTFGADNEFIGSPRLDDLQCVYGSLQGILSAKPVDYVAVHAVFNNEEVGSETKQGAASSFLTDVIARICEKFAITEEDRVRKISESFMISADNAHALHPNYGEKTDPTNKPVLNGGIVIKYNANQKYTTDAVSSGTFRRICKKAGAAVQEYVNPSDIPGGSTLGSIATARVSMSTVDIGLPQLAMHSAYETAGAKDTDDLVKVAKSFFNE